MAIMSDWGLFSLPATIDPKPTDEVPRKPVKRVRIGGIKVKVG